MRRWRQRNLSRDTCARCHEGVRLSQEFGVPGHRVSTYFDSYHGLAAQGGSVVAANCSSCHGVHDILPSSDPRSSVSRANLERNVRQVSQGRDPEVHSDAGAYAGRRLVSAGMRVGAISAGPRWVRLIYIPLIVLVIGAMFLHNLIIWRRKLADRRRAHSIIVMRMTVNQRWQHLASAHQLHRPGDHRLCAQVSGVLVAAPAGHGRAVCAASSIVSRASRSSPQAFITSSTWLRLTKGGDCCAISRPHRAI